MKSFWFFSSNIYLSCVDLCSPDPSLSLVEGIWVVDPPLKYLSPYASIVVHKTPVHHEI